MRFGDVYKKERTKRKLSYLNLSHLLNVDLSTATSIEAGRFLPTFRLLTKIGEIFEWDEKTLVENWKLIEQERIHIKNNPRYPNLMRFLESRNMSQRQYAKELGRSPEYVRIRFYPYGNPNFDVHDLTKTMAIFGIPASEAVTLFLSQEEIIKKGDESNGEGK